MAKELSSVTSFVETYSNMLSGQDMEEKLRADWMTLNGLSLDDEDALEQWMDSSTCAEFFNAVGDF